MGYNPQYNGSGNRSGFSPYNRPSFNGGSQYSNYNQPRQGGYGNASFQRPVKKRSGAKHGFSKDDPKRPYVRGWKYDRTHGLRAFIAGPNKKTHRTASKSGQNWENWTAKVTGPHGVELYNALYHVEKKRVYINDIGIVMSPGSPGGGYTGPYFKRRNR